MTIKPADKHRRFGRETIDQVFGWQFCVRPALVVPIASCNPPTSRQLLGKLSDAIRKLLWAVCIAQIDT